MARAICTRAYSGNSLAHLAFEIERDKVDERTNAIGHLVSRGIDGEDIGVRCFVIGKHRDERAVCQILFDVPARIRMPCPSSAHLTAISPSFVVSVPLIRTASVLTGGYGAGLYVVAATLAVSAVVTLLLSRHSRQAPVPVGERHGH